MRRDHPVVQFHPPLLVDGASRRTYNKERRRRCSKEKVSCGTTSCDPNQVCMEGQRGGWGSREGEDGGGMWDRETAPVCCVHVRTRLLWYGRWHKRKLILLHRRQPERREISAGGLSGKPSLCSM